MLLAHSASAASIDLLARYPFTDSARQGALSADSAPGRAVLAAGWARSASGPARMLDPRASLYLPLAAAGEAEIELRCGLPPGVGPRRVAVSVNGRRVGIVAFADGTSPIVLPVRASATRTGDNLVTLRDAALGRDKPTSGHEPNSSAGLRCEGFALRAVGASSVSRAHLESSPGGADRLVFPAGASARFFVPISADATLRISVCEGEVAVRLRGEAGGSVVSILPAGEERTLALNGLRGAFGLVELLGISSRSVVCGAVVAAQAAAVSQPVAIEGGPRPRNLVLVVIDTLRSDALGAYGNPRGLTPALDALAGNGLVFENTVAQSAWTTPATASILSGLEPTRHGARRLGAPIDAGVPLLAERLQAAGFETVAVITNVNTRAELGFARGFDVFEDLPETALRTGRYAAGAEVVARGMAALPPKGEKPFFLYLHLSEPHAPYAPDPRFATQYADRPVPSALADAADPLAVLIRDPAQRTAENLGWVRAQYDAEVATVDAVIGRLVEELASHGRLEDTLLVVTSDHGEAFGEHGEVGHGRSLFAEELQVPWILHGPGIGPPRRDTSLARQVDIFPTLMAAMGQPAPAGIDGRSLLGGVAAQSRPSFAETSLHRPAQAGFVLGDRKVIRLRGRSLGTRFEVYDRHTDALEERDVAGEHPYLVGWARQELRVRDASGRSASPVPADETVRTRLQLLGYLEEVEP